MICSHDRDHRLDAAAGVIGFLIVCTLLAIGVSKVQGQVSIVREGSAASWRVVDPDGNRLMHESEDRAGDERAFTSWNTAASAAMNQTLETGVKWRAINTAEYRVDVDIEHIVFGPMGPIVEEPDTGLPVVAEPLPKTEPIQMLEALDESSSPEEWPEWIRSVSMLSSEKLVTDDGELPDEEKIAFNVSKAAQNHNIIIVKVDHWNIHTSDGEELQQNINKYATLMRLVNEAAGDDAQVGLYSIVPMRDFWTPIEGSMMDLFQWRERNEKFTAITENVDIIFPALLTFYHDQPSWRKYARANIQEAQRYGKPVMPFLMPTFHPATEMSGQPLPGDFMQMQMELVGAYCGGAVIWSDTDILWSETSGWWKAVKRFGIIKGLSEE